jgi:hypothetical protein
MMIVQARQEQAAGRLDDGLGGRRRKVADLDDTAAVDANIRQPSVDQFRPTDQQGAGA